MNELTIINEILELLKRFLVMRDHNKSLMYAILDNCTIVYEINSMRLIKLGRTDIDNYTKTTAKELAKLDLIPTGNELKFGFEKEVISSVSKLELISIVELLKADLKSELHVIEHIEKLD